MKSEHVQGTYGHRETPYKVKNTVTMKSEHVFTYTIIVKWIIFKWEGVGISHLSWKLVGNQFQVSLLRQECAGHYFHLMALLPSHRLKNNSRK